MWRAQERVDRDCVCLVDESVKRMVRGGKTEVEIRGRRG